MSINGIINGHIMYNSITMPVEAIFMIVDLSIGQFIELLGIVGTV